jgi:prepilin-type N-terminal cleavage/methylation domain-containing protein
MKRNSKGITIIEVMIVVAILAILLAIFIPAFENHKRIGDDPSSFVECKSAIDNTVIRSPLSHGWRQEREQNGYYSEDNVYTDFYPRQGDVCQIHNQ